MIISDGRNSSDAKSTYLFRQIILEAVIQTANSTSLLHTKINLSNNHINHVAIK